MLKVDIVSPLGQFVAGKDISVLTVPSVKGEIAILPGHTDMLCLLGKGLLKLDDQKSFIVYKGIMQVSDGDQVIIAAEKIKKVSELEINELMDSLKDIESKLMNDPMNEDEMNQAREDYEDVLAELSAFT
ncbi:MAG: hypothetical protein V1647_07465 [Pseudomonadota bacterium]